MLSFWQYGQEHATLKKANNTNYMYVSYEQSYYLNSDNISRILFAY